MQRKFVKVHVAVCFIVLSFNFGLLDVAFSAESPARPIRALLVTGGCCHDYTAQKQLIERGLEERANIEVTVVQQGGTTTNTKIPLYEDPNWADGYDIVLHDECFSDVPDPAWTQRILKPHQAGLPAVVIHCAMHCYRDGTDEWFKFCGVTSRRHGAHYAHEVLNRDAEHPIMKGWGAGWANPAGELYWIEKVWPTAHPLAAAKNREKGNEEVCVWTNDYQGTRIFGTTLGHHNETVEHPAFLDLLTRGTLWACGKLDEKYLKPVDPKEARVAAEQAQLADVTLPDGFEATLFAAPPAVNYPVFVATAPDGAAYVSVDKNGSLDREPHRGSVYRLRDIDGDGRADETKLFIADVDSPRGLVWDHDRLYLMHPPHLSAFIDHDADGIADEQQILVKNIAFTFADRPADHTSNGVTLGIDGWLYLAIGDFGFMEAEGTDGRKLQLRGGGVVRVRPDGTGLELYARGTRNILEVAVDPLLNGFTRDNTNDGGGWDIRLHHFTGWEHHGYPTLFTNFSDEIIPPLADYGGGSGCGVLYLDEPGFPRGCGDALYTADWGRNRIYRHRLTPSGATFVPSQEEFIGATRVTDLDVDAMSRLYVTSWKGATFKYEGDEVGYLLRVTPEGYEPTPLPDFDGASDSQLVKLLESPSHRRRLEAQRAVIRRVLRGSAGDSVYRDLSSLAANENKPLVTRVAATLALKQAFGGECHTTLVGLTNSDELRPFALRALTDRDDQLVDIPLDGVMHGLFDENPRTRVEACIAMARLKLIDLAREMTPLLADPDPIVAHTAIQALIAMRSSEACFVVVDEAAADDRQRIGALRVLQSLHDDSVVSGLVLRLERERDAARRRGLLSALCRLDYTEGPWQGNSWGTRPDTRGPYYQPQRWSASDRISRALTAVLADAQGDEAVFLLGELARHRIDLAGTLEMVVAMAKDDSRIVPAAVAQLARADKIPNSAVELLADAAASQGFAPQVRSQAVIVLLKIGHAAAFEQALATVAALHAAGEPSPEYEVAWTALKNVRVLEPHVELLRSKATNADANNQARWAAACLLVLANAAEVTPQAKEIAGQFIASAGAAPLQRLRLLEAALLADARQLEPQVRAAFQDADQAVAAAARRVAAAWKLEPQPTPAGPPLKSLQVEVVMDAALRQHGDVSRGEQVYAKLNCAKCHTVKAGEANRGPHLPQVVKTYKRNQLVESILLPSKSIAQGFVTNAFLLDNGKTLTGFVTSEAAAEVTIRDNEGKEFKIPTARIEVRVKQEISMMPLGLANEISLKDFVSLIDYLESLR